jgi:hypothetical protein
MDHLRAIFDALRAARLLANLEKCTFSTNRIGFLGYVVTPQGIEVDKVKIEAIKNRLTPNVFRRCEVFMVLHVSIGIL